MLRVRFSYMLISKLIHEANTQSRPVSIPITFQNLAKQNEFQVRIVIVSGGNVGLAKWIIDDTHVLSFLQILNEVGPRESGADK